MIMNLIRNIIISTSLSFGFISILHAQAYLPYPEGKLTGEQIAQQAFAVWVGSLMGMLRQCMEGSES